MTRILRHSIPPSVRAIESASRRPTLCFAVRDDDNKTGGMIVREKNLPAETGKTQTPPRSASEIIAEMAAKVARYPAKPKEEWEGMSAEEMFQRGWEYIRDRKEYSVGEKLWIRAAEQGHAKAQCALGHNYAYSFKFFPQDGKKAVKWLHRAAEQGNAKVDDLILLGVLFRDGFGVDQNIAEAEKWFRRAVEQAEQGSDLEAKVLTRHLLNEILRQMG